MKASERSGRRDAVSLSRVGSEGAYGAFPATSKLIRKLRFASGALLGLTPLLSAVSAAETVTYYYTDPQGTVLATTDALGTVTGQFDHRPFGADAMESSQGPGFTGHVFDVESGLVYMQARYYDPQLGRFLSTDPVPGKINLYAYARNNPYMYIDPDGRDDCNDACMQMRHVSDSNSLGRPLSAGENTPLLSFGAGTDKVQTGWTDNRRQIIRDLSRNNHRFNPGVKLNISGTYGNGDAANFDGIDTINFQEEAINGFTTNQLASILGHELFHVVDFAKGRWTTSSDIFRGYAPRARSEVGAYNWSMRTRAHYELDDPYYVKQFKAQIDRYTPCASGHCNLDDL